MFQYYDQRSQDELTFPLMDVPAIASDSHPCRHTSSQIVYMSISKTDLLFVIPNPACCSHKAHLFSTATTIHTYLSQKLMDHTRASRARRAYLLV